MKKIKIIVNIILSFILLLTLIGIIVSNIVKNNIMNEQYIFSKLDEVGFYSKVSDNIKSDFENYIYQSGFPEKILDNLFSEEDVKKDVKNIVDSLYNYTEINVSDDIVRENLDNNINNYLTEQNKKLNDQGKENVSKFEDLIVEQYKNNLNVNEDIIKFANSFIENLKVFSNRCLYNMLVLCAIELVLIVYLNRKQLINLFYIFSSALISLGALIKIAIIFIYKKIDINNVVIFSNALSSLIRNIVNEITNKYDDLANFMLFCGILLVIVTCISFTKKEKAQKEMFYVSREKNIGK